MEVSEDELRLAEDGDGAAAEAPEWQQEMIEDARRVLESDRVLQLPTPFDIHEWTIMQRFADGCPIARQREALLDAIHGRGAFRRFKATIGFLEIEEDWYRFRDAASNPPDGQLFGTDGLQSEASRQRRCGSRLATHLRPAVGPMWVRTQ